MMAGFIAKYSKLLQKTEYGRNTFFHGDKPLQAGQIIRQPEVAEFLRKLAKEGSAYVYTGGWGDRFLSIVNANGGCLTAADLSNYDAKWCIPWTTTYRGYRIHSSSSRSYGGPWVLLALKTLEHTSLPEEPRYWEDPATLELMLRITRQVWSEPDIFDYRVLDDLKRVQSLFTAEYTRSIWERVRDKLPDNFMGLAGSHSYHIIVTDDEGNIASGTISIYSDPWADGLFVEGIPLTSAGVVPWNTKPGERRLSPLSIHLAHQDGQPRIAVGSFSNSIVEASFQFFVKLIDYQMSVRDTVSSIFLATAPPMIGADNRKEN
jgi:gamma-glutamyltranspeptidase/glutathione hydrolase